MKLVPILATTIAFVLCGPTLGQDDLLTVAESSGFQRTARHEEVMRLARRLADSSPRVHLDSLGTTVEGRDIPLLVIADPPVRTAEDATRSGKLVVLALGAIHGGEIAGKDALLMLARELGSEPAPALLEHVVIAVAPLLNGDGNERISRENRPNQVGPSGGVGIRRNAQELDLNRDWVKLEAPETRAVVRFLREWDPAVIIDTHTTNGSFHRYGLTYAGPKHPTGDRRLIEYVRDTMLPEITERLEAEGGPATFHYGNFNEEHTRWTTYPDLPRFGTPYRGLRNRIAVLAEAYAYSTFERRVRDTRAFVLETLEYLAENRETARSVIDEADAARPRSIALRSEVRPFERRFLVRGFGTRSENGRKIRTDEPRDYEVLLIDNFVPTLTVARPAAYLLPPDLEAVTAKLLEHGVKIGELREDVELDIETLRVDDVARAEREFERHRMVRVEATALPGQQLVRAGTLVVSTDQPLGALAAYLLEPQTDDGLCAWNFLDDRLEVGADYPIVRVPSLGPSGLLTVPVRAGPPPEKRPLTFEEVYGSDSPPRFSGRPVRIRQWLDSERYLEERDGKLLAVEARTGRSTAFRDIGPDLESLPTIDAETAARLARRTTHQLNQAGNGVLIEHADDLYYCALSDDGAIGDRMAHRLTSTPAKEELATFSPDGRFVAFVEENDLRVVDIATRTNRALTRGGSDTLRSGKASWVYYEEVFRRRWKTFWWSPDSRWIAFLRIDSSPVSQFTIVDDLPEKQRVERTAYPRPGEPNPRVQLGIVSVGGGDVSWVDLSRYEEDDILITGVGWLPDSKAAHFFVQDRLQTWLDLSTAPVAGGRPTRLLRETTAAWVDPPLGPRFLSDGSFLMTSDATGWRHLYQFEPGGGLRRAITSGEWEVRAIHEVDEQDGVVYVSGTRDSHIASNLYRARIDGTSIDLVTRDRGSHSARVSPDGELFIDRWSAHDHPTRVALRSADGELVRTLDTNPVHALDEYVWCPTELVELEADDGVVLQASIVRPPDFDPSRRYPVWFTTYGGPGAPSVRDSWGHGVWDQVLAQSGIVVFRCDPRSASGRGAQSAWTAYRRLGVQELRDIEDAVAWIASNPWVDTTRIGIGGHSYGGFLTAFAMTHSRAFAAGIASAPVTDWRHYDTIYTERYMLTPQRNAEGYAATSVVEAAADLHGRLLLLHGLLDDNVHMQNTTRLVAALQRAGKQFELMVYPGQRHGIFGRHAARLRWDFIRRNLAEPGPRP